MSVECGTVALTDDTVNYVERTEDGMVSANASGFTAGRIPMAQVTTASGAITDVADWRPAFSIAPRTGWGAPTGTADRTAFDTTTVTLEELAGRVKALADDLESIGVLTS